MRRKGFTLLEVLTVMIVLFIIVLTTILIVIGAISQSKQKAYDNSVYEIFQSAKSYYNDHLKEVNDSTQYHQNILEQLTYQGVQPEKGSIVKINEKGKIAIVLKYGKYCYLKNYTDYKIIKGDMHYCTSNQVSE